MKAEKPVTLLTREGCAFDTRSAQAFVCRLGGERTFRGVWCENLRQVRVRLALVDKASTMKAGLNRPVFSDRPIDQQKWHQMVGAVRGPLGSLFQHSRVLPDGLEYSASVSYASRPRRKRACGSQPTVRGRQCLSQHWSIRWHSWLLSIGAD